jgi:hypothetical protein
VTRAEFNNALEEALQKAARARAYTGGGCEIALIVTRDVYRFLSEHAGVTFDVRNTDHGIYRGYRIGIVKLRCRYRCRYSYEVFHCKVYKREVNRNPIDKQLPISIVHFYWTRSINRRSSYRLRRICLIDGINSGICYGYIGCCPCTIPKTDG